MRKIEFELHGRFRALVLEADGVRIDDLPLAGDHDHRTGQPAFGNLLFEHCGDAPKALHRHADLFRRCRGEGLEFARRDWQHRCCTDQHRGQRRRRQYFPPTHDAPPGTVFARASSPRPGNDLIRRRRLGTCLRMKMIRLELPGVEVSHGHRARPHGRLTSAGGNVGFGSRLCKKSSKKCERSRHRKFFAFYF